MVAVPDFILTDQRIASGQTIGFNLIILSINSICENCIVALSQLLNHKIDAILHQELILASKHHATYEDDNPQLTQIIIIFWCFICDNTHKVSSYQLSRLSSAFI